MPAIRSDLHVHSHHSFDCQGAMAEMAEAAIQGGIDTIAFTEHLELYPGYAYYGEFDIEAYRAEIEATRGRLGESISILSGIEASYLPAIDTTLRDYFNGHAFDVRIGSVHVVDGLDDGPGYDLSLEEQAAKAFAVAPLERVARRYVEVLTALIESGLFTAIGHLDGLKRFVPPDLQQKALSLLAGSVDPALESLAASGTALEINTAGFRHSHGLLYPDPVILKRFQELGGRVVAYGSDAHTPRDVGAGRDELVTLMKQHGLRLEFL